MRGSGLPVPFEGSVIAGGFAAPREAAPSPISSGHASQWTCFESDGSVAMAFGRLRVSSEGSSSASTPVLDGSVLLSLWQRHGEEILDRLSGEFVLFLWDQATRRGLIAVDRFSTFPVYWCRSERGISFAGSPARALELAGRSLELDPQSILAYAYFHVIPAPFSIWHGAQRLANGCALRLNAQGADLLRYWVPNFAESKPFDFTRERRAFMAALQDGVAECTEGVSPDRIGCFLSGGTDSSTIAGLLGRLGDVPARTFSIGFDVQGYDESRYSQLAARHFGTDHTEYYLSPDDAHEGLHAVASSYEQPFGNSSAVPTWVCARLARERGVVRMLGGDGGDELYGGNERYAKQAVFARYQSVPAALRRRLLEPMLFGPLRGVETKLFSKARSYVEQANTPLPDRMQGRYNLLNWLGTERIFTRDFLAGVNLEHPCAHEREIWGLCDAQAQLNRLLAYDFKFTLADNDLPKVTRMCHAANVQIAFPMLTRSLVEHSLALRPGEKLKGTRLRHFFRESLRGFLPDEIIDKPKHGFGMPFGSWLMTHDRLRRTADDALGSLATRNLVRHEFIGELRTRLTGEHPGYYGTMVWVLTMLELWLQGSKASDVRLSV